MEAWRQFWQARTARERMILTTGAVALLLILLYLFAWQPLNTERKRLRATLPDLRAKAAQMRLDAEEVARLRGAIPRSVPNLRTVLDQSAQLSGLRDKLTSTDMLDSRRARVTLADVPFDAFIGWVSQMERQARVRMEAGQVEALPQSGRVKVQANFALPGGPT